MNRRKESLILLATCVLVAAGLTAARADTESWRFPDVVDLAFVVEHATIPVRDDVAIVDSRPKGRRYDVGHIPGAISIPDRKFDKMTELLPTDRSTLLIFYCGGEKCQLSHNSAYKAQELGYTNVKVFSAGYPAWKKAGNLGSVSTQHVKKLLDSKANVVIVDARPTARRFDKGHVPTAISIPTRKFEELAHMLPADKSTPLLFYCGGLKCPLSPKAAAKAIEAGYTDVMLYQAGYPDWVAAYGPGPTAADDAAMAKSGVAIDTGGEVDTITFASFRDVVDNTPDSVHLIDVRSAEEFATGALPTAKHMTVDDVEEQVAELPADKPIIFICSTGARSGEAYDIVKAEREELTVYFLNANATYGKDGSYTLEPADG